MRIQPIGHRSSCWEIGAKQKKPVAPTGFSMVRVDLRVDSGHEPTGCVRLVRFATSRTELTPVGRCLPGIGGDSSLTLDVDGAGSPESVDIVLELIRASGPPPVPVVGATLNIGLHGAPWIKVEHVSGC